MSALQVSEAQARLLANVSVLSSEPIGLSDAHNRVLAVDVGAMMTQPPFPASAMDGYAVRSRDFSEDFRTDADKQYSFSIIGVSQAGHPFLEEVGEGQAVRIYTGGQVPPGADAVVIQENCELIGALEDCANEKASDRPKVLVTGVPDANQYVRAEGYDFHEGEVLVSAGTVLTYRHLALLASMNVPEVQVVRRPKVAILATGDELVFPGDIPGPGQIISSVPFGICALIEKAGGEPQMLGIAKDTFPSLEQMIEKAKGCDVLITIGGASVGDHDLVRQALIDHGMDLDFWSLAMRPGKPLMVGHLGQQTVVGVPGNPVSAIICSFVFVVPLVRALLGILSPHTPMQKMKLLNDVPKTGPRQHYMRATVNDTSDGVLSLEDQDSSLQVKFAQSNALIVRPPFSDAAKSGEPVDIILLD